MRLRAFAILAIATALMLPSAAGAQTPTAPAAPATKSNVFTKITMADVAKLLQDNGYRAEIATGLAAGKTPRIYTGMGGYKVTIYLYSCDSDAGCGSMEFASFLNKTAKMTLSIVNKWNQEKRYAKAYLDTDGDLNLEYDVSFSGGVTTDHIIQAASLYELLLPALDQFVTKGGN